MGGTSSSNVTGGVTSVIVVSGGASSVVATGGASSVVATGGTSSVVATGGTSSVVATGGASAQASGGTSSAGGSSSAYLTAVEGWITDAAHTLQGPIYTYADEGGSTITPDCTPTTGACYKAQGTTTKFCAAGTTIMAVDTDGMSCELTSEYCDWDTYWGASMAINPNHDSTTDTAMAWDASKYTGISFKMSITTKPPSLRVYLNLMDGTQFCYETGSSKTYTLAWTQFREACYTSGGAQPTATDLAQVKSIVWQAGSNASKDGEFDFCVDSVKITP